jgi:hypothetical protein
VKRGQPFNQSSCQSAARRRPRPSAAPPARPHPRSRQARASTSGGSQARRGGGWQESSPDDPGDKTSRAKHAAQNRDGRQHRREPPVAVQLSPLPRSASTPRQPACFARSSASTARHSAALLSKQLLLLGHQFIGLDLQPTSLIGRCGVRPRNARVPGPKRYQPSSHALRELLHKRGDVEPGG